MTPIPNNNRFKTFAACDLAPPGIPPPAAWRVTLNFLNSSGVGSDRYCWQAYCSRRQSSSNLSEELSGSEILGAMETDEAAGFNIRVVRGTKSQWIDLCGPYPKIPWQHFTIASEIPDLHPTDWAPIIEQFAVLGRLLLGVIADSDYTVWQRCKDPQYYAEHFGSVAGLCLNQVAANPPFPMRTLVDTSTNPGRSDAVNGGPAMVASDMWLGPAFWTYAPCRKEEILAQPWLEVHDTDHFLYIKSYSEPFTRPDGEQGEIQRRLWQLLFHSDCRWPPIGNIP